MQFWENVRNYRGIKHVRTEARRSYLPSQPNYHTVTLFGNLSAILMKSIHEKISLFRSINIQNQ